MYFKCSNINDKTTMKYEYHTHDLLKKNEIRNSTNSVLITAFAIVDCAVFGGVVTTRDAVVVVTVVVIVGVVFDNVTSVNHSDQTIQITEYCYPVEV
jgi:hypothetical protein